VGLDVSFGQQGQSEVSSGLRTVEAVVAQPEGQLVVVGEGVKALPGSDSATVLGAVRLLADGRADPTFGANGAAIAPLGADGRGTVTGAASQGDGKLVVVGYAPQGSPNPWLVARLDRDGSVDTTFGSGGAAAAPLAAAFPASVAISADGSIFVVGTVRFPLGDYCCDGNIVLAKYDAGGELDPAFGPGGVVRTPVGVAGGDDYATALAVQADGQIVVGGFAFVTGEQGNGARQEAMLLRYTARGTLDADFGAGGIVSSDSYVRVNALAFQGDGKLVVSLSSGEPTGELVVARHTTAGALDPTFGSGGGARIQLPLADATASVSIASDLFALRDGSTLVAGSRTGEAFYLAKLAANGALDTTIGVDGVLTTGLANGFVAATSDGKAIVAGNRPADPGGAIVIERVCL